MPDDKKLALSRRQALGGLGAVGAAAAGAGLGTTALFSDEESFNNNSITAGQLDLVVDYETSYDFGSEGDDSGEINGNPGDYSYVLSDVKPGDSGSLLFCPKVVDNPGWVYVGSDGIVEYENGQTEPEADVDASDGDPGQGAGELATSIQVTVSYCDETGSEIRELNNPADYTLADLSKDLETGFLLDGENVNDGSTDAYPDSSGPDDQQGPCLCIDWNVPASVGNEIQSDSVELDFMFAATQERNNPDPANPFVDHTVGSGSAFDYSSVSAAVSAASAGDVIGLADETFTQTSSLNVGGLTLTALQGASPTLEFDSGRLNLGDDATVCRLHIDLNNGTRMYANSGDNLRLLDNTVSISGTSNYGLRIEGSGFTDARIARNTFTQAEYTAGDGNPQGVLISGGSGYTVEDNTFTGPTSGSPRGQAVLVSDQGSNDASDIDILDNDITGWDQGVFLFETASADIFDVDIVGNTISGFAGSDGIVAFDNTGSDGFEDLNGEDSESAQEAALSTDNGGVSVDVSD